MADISSEFLLLLIAGGGLGLVCLAPVLVSRTLWALRSRRAERRSRRGELPVPSGHLALD